MTALVGGIGALVLGIILLVVWWNYFLALIAGAIPLILLLGGALATYLGVEEPATRHTTPAVTSRSSRRRTDASRVAAATSWRCCRGICAGIFRNMPACLAATTRLRISRNACRSATSIW